MANNKMHFIVNLPDNSEFNRLLVRYQTAKNELRDYLYRENINMDAFETNATPANQH